MDEQQVRSVLTVNDVMWARLQARGLARLQGWSTMDQAPIAVTVAAASALGLGNGRRGPVTWQRLFQHGCPGLQANCSVMSPAETPGPDGPGKTRWLGDELRIEVVPPDRWRITIVKWHSGATKLGQAPGSPADFEFLG